MREVDKWIKDVVDQANLPFEQTHWDSFKSLLNEDKKKKSQDIKRTILGIVPFFLLGLVLLVGSYIGDTPQQANTIQVESMPTQERALFQPRVYAQHEDTIGDLSSPKRAEVHHNHVKRNSPVAPGRKPVVPVEAQRNNSHSSSDPANPKKETVEERAGIRDPQVYKSVDMNRSSVHYAPVNELVVEISAMSKAKDIRSSDYLNRSNQLDRKHKRSLFHPDWRLTAHVGPQFTSWNNMSLLALDSKLQNGQVNSEMGMETGIALQYSPLNQIVVSTGVTYQETHLTLHVPEMHVEEQRVEDNSYYSTEDRSRWTYTDSMRTATGTWHYTDSTYQVIIDSTFHQRFDTSTQQTYLPAGSSQLTLQRVSIPAMIGANWNYKRWNVSLSAGVAVDWLFGVKGEWRNRSNERVEASSLVAIEDLRFRYLGSLALDYHVSSRWFVGIQPVLSIPGGKKSNQLLLMEERSSATMRIRMGYRIN